MSQQCRLHYIASLNRRVRLRVAWQPKKNVTSRAYRSTLLHFLGSQASELCKGGNFRRTVAVSIMKNGIDAASVTNGDPSNASVTNGDPSNAFYAPAVPKSQPPRSIRNSNLSFMSYHTSAALLRLCELIRRGASPFLLKQERHRHMVCS